MRLNRKGEDMYLRSVKPLYEAVLHKLSEQVSFTNFLLFCILIVELMKKW